MSSRRAARSSSSRSGDVVGCHGGATRPRMEAAGAVHADALGCAAPSVDHRHLRHTILDGHQREQHRQGRVARTAGPHAFTAASHRPSGVRPSGRRRRRPDGRDAGVPRRDAGRSRCASGRRPAVPRRTRRPTTPPPGSPRAGPICPGMRYQISPLAQGPRRRVARDLGSVPKACQHRIPASSRMCGGFLRRARVRCATCERCGHTPRRARRRPGCGRRADPTPRSRGARVLRGGRCARRGRRGRLGGVRRLPRRRRERARRRLLRRRGRARALDALRRRQPRAADRPRRADGADAARRPRRGRARARRRGAPHPTARPLERGAHVGRPHAPRRGGLHRPRGGPPAACCRPDGRRARRAAPPSRRRCRSSATASAGAPSRSTTPSRPPA